MDSGVIHTFFRIFLDLSNFRSRVFVCISTSKESLPCSNLERDCPLQLRRGKRRVISGELFQSELFWRVIFMQIRLFIVINLDSLQSQLSSST